MPVANKDNQQRRYIVPDEMNKLTDDKIGKLIYSRFQHIFKSHELVIEIPLIDPLRQLGYIIVIIFLPLFKVS